MLDGLTSRWLHKEQGDVAGARGWYERAVDSGHAEFAPAATRGLEELLNQQDDGDGARTRFL